jgi:pimeloyl-ACP methyl ester carboxylesterase
MCRNTSQLESSLNGIRPHTSYASRARKGGSTPSRTRTILAATAAALAAAAVYNTYRASRAEQEHPPRGEFITVDGVRLHYLRKGNGPPVVLIHGNVVTNEDWVMSGILDRVARHHTVFAFDRPGFGYSDRPQGSMWTAEHQADLLIEALARLGVEMPVVVGHSWGAIVALEMGLQGGASGLVLLAGYYQQTMRYDAALVAAPAIPILGDLLRYTVSPLVGAALMPANLKAMFSPLPVPARFTEEFPHAFPVRPSQIRAESQDAVTMMPAVNDLEERLRNLDIPVFIMAGDHDRIVDHEDHAVWLHDRIPQSNLQIIPEAGHMMHYAVPNSVVAAIDTVSQKVKRRLEPVA